MSFFDPQNPGIGGIDELTPAEEAFLTTLAGNGGEPNLNNYFYKPGISGGQIAYGGTQASENLTISSTSDATKGKILFGNSVYDEVNDRLGLGITTPTYKLDVKGLNQESGIRSDMGLDFNPVVKPTFASGNLALTSGGANLSIGLYRYSVTYLTAIGETNVSVDGTITTDASNRKVTITVPISTDVRVTGRRIYRTTVGAASSTSKVLTTINDNTTDTYSDDTADGSLTGGTAYFRSNNTSYYLTLNGSQIFNATPSVNANTFFGYLVGNNTLTNGRNVGFGADVMRGLTSGAQNVAVGNSTLRVVTNGSNNIAVGFGALYADTAGGNNVAIGYDTNFYNQTGGNNTNIGAFSTFGSSGHSQTGSTSLGYYTNYLATGASLHLGAYAGRYETANNKILLDTLDRSTEARGRDEALIYGVTNATPANQTLILGGGGKVGINISPTARLTLPAGTATANTAPLKFTSGTNLTTAEAGAIEYDGAELYFSPSTTRYKLGQVITGSSTLASGVYTPTLTNGTNVSASTAYQCQYMRVGDTVTVSGKVDIDQTAAGAYELGFSIPIASNLGAEEDLAGVGAGINAPSGSVVYIKADTANDRASFNGSDTDVSNHSHFFSFTYQII